MSRFRETLIARSVATVVRFDGKRWQKLGYVPAPRQEGGYFLAMSTAGADGQYPHYSEGGNCLGGASNPMLACEMILERWGIRQPAMPVGDVAPPWDV